MNIRVDLQKTIYDGTEVVFRSPVDCSQITGLIVYYPGYDGETTSKEFAFADAHGNNVGDIDHLFAENVVVKVILDLSTNMAFVQNADTNAYLEGRFEALVEDIAASKTLIVTIDGDTADHTSEEIYAHIQNGGVAYLFDGNYYIPINASADDAAAIYMYDDMIADHYYISGDKVNHSEMYFENQSAVLYTEQSLTDEQKAQARNNMGAASQNDFEGVETRLTNLENASSISWEQVQKLVRLGLGREHFPVGTQFLVKNSLVGDFLYDVVAHDHFTSVDDESAHTMTLMCHDALLWDQYPYEGGIPYDHPEAFYVNDTDEDLPAGFYSFQMPITHYNWTIGYYYAFIAGKKVGDEYYPLEPNGKVELCNEGGPEIYPTRDNDLSLHYTLIPKYNEDGTSEYGDRFATGAIYGPYATLAEAKAVAAENGTYQGHLGKVGALTEADHSINYWQRITKGSNNYKNSVIREAILHSASENLDGNQSKFDTTTADRSTGDHTVSLVDYFDPEFLAVVGKVLVPCVTGGKYEPYGTDLAIEDWVEDTFFLPSLKEVTGDDNIANDLSTQLEYFKDASNVDRIKYANGYASYWWTRSPGPASNAYTVYAIKTNGDKTNVSPDVARGIVPMVNIVG